MSIDLSEILNTSALQSEQSGDGFNAYLGYSKAADAGNIDAMINQASMYFEGTIVQQDLDRAFGLYKQAYTLGEQKQKESALTGIIELLDDLECIDNPSVTGEFTNRTMGDESLLLEIQEFFKAHTVIKPLRAQRSQL